MKIGNVGSHGSSQPIEPRKPDSTSMGRAADSAENVFAETNPMFAINASRTQRTSKFNHKAAKKAPSERTASKSDHAAQAALARAIPAHRSPSLRHRASILD